MREYVRVMLQFAWNPSRQNKSLLKLKICIILRRRRTQPLAEFFPSCLPWCIKRAAHRSIFTTHIKRNMNIFTFFFFLPFFPLASNSLEKYLAFFACVARFFVKKPSDYSPKTMNGEWMLFAEFSVYSWCQNRPLLVDDIGISLMAIFHA